jgi:glycine oxidase
MALRVIVVGGGVVGLAAARATAADGASVVVLESAARSKEASWAAAGILGAGSEALPEALLPIALEALAAWPALARDLLAETGVDVHLRTEGTMLVALEEGDLPALKARAATLAARGLSCARLSRAAALAREPALALETIEALHVPEARVDNRLLWEAYARSVAARGVGLRTGETVDALLVRGERVVGVRVAGRDLEADAVVIAAGAWSDAIAKTAGFALPMTPVKGILARVALDEGVLSHVVKRGLPYAVPRQGFGVVIGTTVEEAGFDRTVGPAATADVVAAAARLVPAIAGARVVDAWTGFRPRIADGLPAVGAVPGRAGLFLATGHHRNGILLCEATGRLVADAVLARANPHLAALSPARFSPRPA